MKKVKGQFYIRIHVAADISRYFIFPSAS